MDVSTEQLKKNRQEHVSYVRNTSDYIGDVKATIDGVVHMVSRGKIAMDGAGNVRAYNHLIRGSQHCLIVYSLAIMKPILVVGHQTSCIHCSRELTRMMHEQQLPMNKIQYQNIGHKGTCYKNTSVGPAVAEEIACVEAADRLLNDENGKPLPSDEAIFAEVVVSDGDTRGSLKFIETQKKNLGEPAGVNSTHVPDIGHFIKCISNGFYKLRTTNKEVSGVGLLEPNRIRSMSADVSRHLREYKLEKQSVEITNIGKEEKEELIKNQRKECLQRIDSIAHHHCGNHQYCTKSHCKYKEIEYLYEPTMKNMKSDYSKAEFDYMVQEKYQKVSRFNGITMDISNDSQLLLKKVISSRLNEDNVDRIAEILSSNCCEQYFGFLAMYTQGKRLNLDKTDSWRVLQYFVCGIRSSEHFNSDIFTKIGVKDTKVSILKQHKLKKRSEYQMKYHNSDKQILRRKVTKQVRAHLIGKDEKKSTRHKTNKMKPTEVSITKHKRPKTTSKCANCGCYGHTKTACAEPLMKKVKITSKISVKDINDMFK